MTVVGERVGIVLSVVVVIVVVVVVVALATVVAVAIVAVAIVVVVVVVIIVVITEPVIIVAEDTNDGEMKNDVKMVEDGVDSDTRSEVFTDDTVSLC